MRENEEWRSNQWLTQLRMVMRKEPHITLLDISLNITIKFTHLVHSWESCMWQALCWVIGKYWMTWSFLSKWSSTFVDLKKKTKRNESLKYWVMAVAHTQGWYTVQRKHRQEPPHCVGRVEKASQVGEIWDSPWKMRSFLGREGREDIPDRINSVNSQA